MSLRSTAALTRRLRLAAIALCAGLGVAAPNGADAQAPRTPTAAELIGDGFSVVGMDASGARMGLALSRDESLFLCRIGPDAVAPLSQKGCVVVAGAGYLETWRARLDARFQEAVQDVQGAGPGCVFDPTLLQRRLRAMETEAELPQGALIGRIPAFRARMGYLEDGVAGGWRLWVRQEGACSTPGAEADDVARVQERRLTLLGARIRAWVLASGACSAAADFVDGQLLNEARGADEQRAFIETLDLMEQRGEVRREAAGLRLLKDCP